MNQNIKHNTFVLGIFIFLGLVALGYLLGDAAIRFKEYERTVTVKGLSEREYPADIVIWPIMFSEADNNLEKLYASIESGTSKIRSFLEQNGIAAEAISSSIPTIIDKSANFYGGGQTPEFRFVAEQTVTVYSDDIETVRNVMNKLPELGKQGIVFTGGDRGWNRTEYLFTRLNDIKPEMIEEATQKAREVALKFAEDSQSKLGKIKRAYQGQFSISDRDKNNPHVKQIRVVSTIEYYLSD